MGKFTLNMEEEGIVVVSCFDGMACARMALDVLGVKVKKYYAFEIDKYAMAVAKANYPDIIHLGDIRNASIKKLSEERIDLICGGSPCQGFSFAGKQLAFDDPRSKLFFEFVRLVNECKELNPDVLFLLENVKMKREHELVISKYMGVSPIEINAALVSAQNRKRNFWTNIYNRPIGLFGDMYCDIPQPADKGILLKDILQPENEVDEKYYLKSETVEKLVQYRNRQKENGNGFTAKFHEQTEKMSTLKKGGAGCDDLIVATPCGNHSDMDTEQMLEPKTDGKTNSLTSVQKDNMILCGDYRSDEGFRWRKNGKAPTLTKGAENSGTQYNSLVMTLNDNQSKKFNPEVNAEKSCCLTLAQGRAGSSSEYMDSVSKLANLTSHIRRLTPTECCRLQSIPEHIITIMLNCGVSDSQLYKMLGNGWNIEVIVHILSYAPFCKKD